MSPSRLRERAANGNPPVPGTRVVVARISDEAKDEEAARVAKALVGLRGVIAEDGFDAADVKLACVQLDGADAPVHFGWDELELEEIYDDEEDNDARSADHG